MMYRITTVKLNGATDQMHFAAGQYEDAMCYFDSHCNKDNAFVLWLEYGNCQFVMVNSYTNQDL